MEYSNNFNVLGLTENRGNQCNSTATGNVVGIHLKEDGKVRRGYFETEIPPHELRP